MTDIIDLIDQVTAPTCGHCTKPLRPDGPSADFCGEVCAEAWNAGLSPWLSEPPPSWEGPLASMVAVPQPAVVDLRPFSGEQPTFLPTTPLPGFRMELTDGRTWPVPPPLPLFILAGHIGEARRFAQDDLHLSPLSWHYVHETRDPYLLGVSRRWRYLTVGTFWERHDAHDIYEYVTLSRRLLRAEPADLDALARVQRSPVDGSWDVTEQRPPWQHDLFPTGTRFTLPGRQGIWTITQLATQTFEESTQDRAPQFDYVMRNEQREKVYVSHEFLTDAVGVRRLPDRAE